MTKRETPFNAECMIIITLAVVVLLISAAVGGFVAGRQSALAANDGGPVVTTAADTIEVTRVVTVVTTPSATSHQPPATPTNVPLPTLPPAPADPSASAGDAELDPEDLDVLWEVWNLVQSDFDGEIPADEVIAYSIVQGALETLDDPYTRFLPPETARQFQEQMEGAFEGIGAFVELNEDGFLVIVSPIEGAPADVAGLENGDVVIAVDGEPIEGETLEEIISRVRGPRDTEVTLTIAREGVTDPFDVTLTRAVIEIPIVESEMLPENVGYVRLTSFAANADEQLRPAVSELLAQNPQGLILDLRNNGGGFLDQAVAVADLFLPEGVILFERNSRGTLQLSQEYRAESGDSAEAIPLVVLVNDGSASASEIVAGAIQDTGRGILLGETTFGKGSVQQTHTLSDGSELRVTIARWYTPNNQSIDETGIAPDIEVPTPEEFGGPEDTQLQRAVEYLLNGR